MILLIIIILSYNVIASCKYSFGNIQRLTTGVKVLYFHLHLKRRKGIIFNYNYDLK
jgi:hypothetical protein